MQLSLFIRSRIEPILAEWDSFAGRNAPAGSHMSAVMLRDHAKEMLLAIAADIESPQDAKQQTRKSQGLAPAASARSAASAHGQQRQQNDFTLVQVNAEFRALRATVLRLWLPQVTAMSKSTVLQLIRFNEAIDQAVAESLRAYMDATTEARNLLLAVLGHDLRAPLANMALAGEMLAKDEISTERRLKLAHTIRCSSKLMTSMVADLLGYTRVQFGKGMPVERAWCDISSVLDAAMADARATNPQTQYVLRTTGEPAACYDGALLHQLFMNLLVNAAQHGAKSQPVTIVASGAADRICVHITNHGQPIPAAALKSIFKPLVQITANEPSDTRPRTSLGLGLFIAREIAEAHGGTVSVRSDEVGGTTFTVDLPLDLTCEAPARHRPIARATRRQPK